MRIQDLKNGLKKFERKLFVVYSVGLLTLSLLSICSNYILKDQAARTAASFIKRTVKLGDNRETIYTLSEAKLDHFSAVVYYNEEGRKLFSLPPQLDPDFIGQPNFFSRMIFSRIVIDLYLEEAEHHKIGSVLFVFNRLSHLPYALGIWAFFLVGVIPILKIERRRLMKEQARELHHREESSRADLARRVRHDIRSPFGALQIATRNMKSLPTEQQTIIRQSIDRLSEIISELELVRPGHEGQPVITMPSSSSTYSVLSLAQEIIREKRLQPKKDIEILPQFAPDSFLFYADIEPAELKRTLSNIIDNALEASKQGSRILVCLDRRDNMILIQVKDHGSGISLDDLKRVKEKGFTRKNHGSGLGLFYAEKTARNAGGLLAIESELNKGTIVTIFLPAQKPPELFIEKLLIPQGGNIVIVDDQESVHHALRLRFDELKASSGGQFNVRSFYRPSVFLEWYNSEKPQNTLFLLDYDFGTDELSGLDIYQQLHQRENAVLVTGHYDLDEVQSRCKQAGLGVLPKSYVSLVQVEST